MGLSLPGTGWCTDFADQVLQIGREGMERPPGTMGEIAKPGTIPGPYGRPAPSPLDPFPGFRVGTDRGGGLAAQDFGRRDSPFRCACRGRGEARRASAGHGFTRAHALIEATF